MKTVTEFCRTSRSRMPANTLLLASCQEPCNDGEAMRLAIEAGMGIGVKSAWNAYKALQAGALVEVLPDHPLLTKTARWALYPAGRLVPPKVRAMIDFLISLYTPVPPWEVSTEHHGGTT